MIISSSEVQFLNASGEIIFKVSGRATAFKNDLPENELLPISVTIRPLSESGITTVDSFPV